MASPPSKSTQNSGHFEIINKPFNKHAQQWFFLYVVIGPDGEVQIDIKNEEAVKQQRPHSYYYWDCPSRKLIFVWMVNLTASAIYICLQM